MRDSQNARPRYAYTGHGAVVAASLDDEKSDPDCRVGDEAATCRASRHPRRRQGSADLAEAKI
jgi:hypothetical protein